MERFALQELIKWKNSERRKPLMVWGARQTGKTTLCRDLFAKNYFPDHYIYIDFKVEDEICDYCFNTANAKKIIEFISLNKQRTIDENTLLIFDEVQECPSIVSALKYFCQDFREIPVIATGSMVQTKILRESHKRGKGNKSRFLFPVGKINEITIYPLTFEEYLYNSNTILYKTVKEAYDSLTPLEAAIHEMALDYFYRYLLIGGMPEALDAYLSGETLLNTQGILASLYDNYLADMQLYQASPEAILKSRAIYKNIYRQLSKENKAFSPGELEKNSKRRDYASSLQWLELAQVIHLSYQLKERVTMPLFSEENATFRIYLGDIGMFSYQSDTNASSFISNDRENTLSGIFYENFVANELIAKGIPLFYWKGKSSSELEFIVESNNHLYPIDVKKGRGALNSLSHFKDHNSFEHAIKVSKNSYGFQKEDKLETIPFYWMSFLATDLKNGSLSQR